MALNIEKLVPWISNPTDNASQSVKAGQQGHPQIVFNQFNP